MKSYIRFYFIVALVLFSVCFIKTNFDSFCVRSNSLSSPPQSSSFFKGLSRQEKDRFLFREAFSRMELDQRLFIEGCWDQKMLNQRALTIYVVTLDSQARWRVMEDVRQGYHPMEAIDVERDAMDQKGNSGV